MNGKIPLILGCARLPPDISRSPASLRSINDKFYLLVGDDYPKRVFRVDFNEGVKLTPFLDDSTLLDKIQNLKRELLGSPRSPGEPIAINWGQELAGLFIKGNYVLVYTPLTGLMKFRKSYHSADDTVAAVVGCNQKRCSVVIWDPLTGASSEHDIELNKLRSVSCRRGLCVINGSEESAIIRPGANPVYLPLTPVYPLASCEGNSYLMYKSEEGVFVIKVTGNSIDPLIPIEGMPTAACLNDSLILCTSGVGCGVLKERLWMGLTNRFFIPLSAAETAALNPLEGTEVILANSSGVVASIRSSACAPNDEGLLLCISGDHVVVSSVHTMVEPSVEVLKGVVDAESYAVVRVRLPGKCSEVEVIGDVSGHRLERDGFVHLYLRPVRLGDVASPVIVIRSPLMEFARRITVASSAPRLDSFIVERAVASVLGRLVNDPEMNALIVGHATILKTSPGTWSVHVICPPGFRADKVYGKDSSVNFFLVGRSKPGTAVPISFELIDEIGTKYVIPGSVVVLREARIDQVVRSSRISVGRDRIKAPGSVRILCADGRIVGPDIEEHCLLPSLVEAVLVEDDFQAKITKVISCTDPDIPKNFDCAEVDGGVEGVTISGNGVLNVKGSVGLTVVCGKAAAAGKNVEVGLGVLDLVDGCRVYLALGNQRRVVISRDELVRGALLAAMLAAKELLARVGEG